MHLIFFQNFKYSKLVVISISLFMVFVLTSCLDATFNGSPTPVDPTPSGYTLKVNMPAEYKNGIPAHGLLPSIEVEVSDSHGKVAENIKVTYQVKTVGDSVDRPSEITSIATNISWELGYHFGEQTMEMSAYKSDSST
jgi:hypothetical protein